MNFRGDEIKHLLTHERQMSDAFILGALLAFSGGFQDAYTYMVRDHVFANAQTGNIVLMSTYLMRGEWATAARYLVPLFAFSLGIFIAELIHRHYRDARRIHWRQLIVLGEFIVMLIAGLLPRSVDMLANSMISLSSAAQVQAFRKVSGHPYASTMCIGNLKSGFEALADYTCDHDRSRLKWAACYFGIILIFGIGAGMGGNLSMLLGTRTIWCSCAFLALAFVLMQLK